MPKAVKEWWVPAIVLSVLAAVFSAGGAWAVNRYQVGQIDNKADRADVDRALAAKADRADVAALGKQVDANTAQSKTDHDALTGMVRDVAWIRQYMESRRP